MNLTLKKWKIEGIDTLDKFKECLVKINRTLEVDNWQGEPPRYSVTSNIEGDTEILDRNIKIENNEYRYISFNIYIERARRAKSWHDSQGLLKDRKERVNVYQSNMIAFEEHGSISIITFSAPTTVSRIFKHAFDSEELKDVMESSFNIKEDFLYWLLKRLRDYPNTDLYNNINVNISGLYGYLGSNGNNDCRGNGRRVLAVLGTLAVIFSSEKLKSLRPEFQHNGNIVVIEINEDNTIKLYEDDYLGNFSVYTGQERSNILALYTINVLLPMVLDAYNKNIADSLWSVELKLDFLRTIGEEIKERVQEELDSLELASEEEEEDEEI